MPSSPAQRPAPAVGLESTIAATSMPAACMSLATSPMLPLLVNRTARRPGLTPCRLMQHWIADASMTPGRSLLGNTSIRSPAPVATISVLARTFHCRSITPGSPGHRSFTSTRLSSLTAHASALRRNRTLPVDANSVERSAAQSPPGTPSISVRRRFRQPPGRAPLSTSRTSAPAPANAPAAESPAGPAPTTSASQWWLRVSNLPTGGGCSGACASPASLRISGSWNRQPGQMKVL